MDKNKYQFEGLKWLHELELLNNPQVINTLKFNILATSNRIKEVELLIYRENKTMLVLVELTWFGRKFYKRQIFTDVQEALSSLLPTFRFRVTDEPQIMEMAVARVKKALTGGKNENSINLINNGIDRTGANASSSDSTNFVGSIESSKTSSEEQSNTDTSLLSNTSENDSKQS